MRISKKGGVNAQPDTDGREEPVASLELVGAHRLGEGPVGAPHLAPIALRQPRIGREPGPEVMRSATSRCTIRMARSSEALLAASRSRICEVM